MGVKKVSLGVLVILLGASALALPSAKPVSLYVSQAMHNSSKAEADRLFKLGEQQLKSDQPKAALESFQKALPIYQQIKERLAEGHTHRSIGNAYLSLKDYPQAIAHQQQALSIAREIKNPDLEARTLLSLGKINLLAPQGNPLDGIDFYQQSLAISRASKNPEIEQKALSNLKSTIEFLEKILVNARDTKDKREEIKILVGLGQAYRAVGDNSKAIASFEQALAIARELKDTQLEKSVQILSSDQIQNNPRKAEADRLLQQGFEQYQASKFEAALQSWQQALIIYREIKDPQGEGDTLGLLGDVYYHKEDYPKLIESQKQRLKIARELKDREIEGTVLGNLGLAYNHLGDYSEAIEYQQQSLKIAQEIKNREREGDALKNLGLVFYKQGNLRLAESILFESMKVQESLRDGLPDKNKITISDTQRGVYRILQQVLIAQNKIDAALEVSESGRARAFADLISSRLLINDKKKNQLAKQLTISEVKQIAKTQNYTLVEYSIISDEFKIQGKPEFKESYLYIWVIKPTGEIAFKQVDLKPLWQKQKTSLEDLVNKNLKDLGVAIDSPRSANNQPSNQQNFAVGDLVRRNTEDRDNDQPWKVVAVNPQNRTVKIWNPTWEKTETPIEQTFAQVTKVTYSHKAYTYLQELHKILIDPIADLLPKDPNARVIFIPQGSLFFVPFPALQDANRNYLIQKHTIQTAPSIQVLDLTHQQLSHQQRQKLSSASTDALIVGNPTMPKVSLKPGEPATRLNPLPDAEEEVKKIAQIFKTNPIIGDRATKSAILPLLPKARIIHFATHGLLDDFTAGSIPGAIALAPEVFNNKGKTEETNGLLTASEIFDLKLNAELVVLSACDTGRGKLSGDGVIGLSRSLISAGVPSVIVSLWSIPDAPTASLMTEFYQRLQQGDDKASALRQAMLTTMEKHPDPKNWAAFTLIGESN